MGLRESDSLAWWPADETGGCRVTDDGVEEPITAPKDEAAASEEKAEVAPEEGEALALEVEATLEKSEVPKEEEEKEVAPELEAV